MINSDFDTNFKIDLLKLLNILNTNEKELFTKFNPEKYRGLIIGYYWNTEKELQDGKCLCKSKCNGKGNGTGDGQCKKITISIFKSGSIIITGGRLIKQIEDAYKLINNILKENYFDIIKLSILDYIDNSDEEENVEEEIYLKPITEKKIVKIKKNIK
jgi:TATA-box binding protein (TBP) (component of TFIID and TFIIIB)